MHLNLLGRSCHQEGGGEAGLAASLGASGLAWPRLAPGCPWWSRRPRRLSRLSLQPATGAGVTLGPFPMRAEVGHPAGLATGTQTQNRSEGRGAKKMNAIECPRGEWSGLEDWMAERGAAEWRNSRSPAQPATAPLVPAAPNQVIEISPRRRSFPEPFSSWRFLCSGTLQQRAARWGH